MYILNSVATLSKINRFHQHNRELASEVQYIHKHVYRTRGRTR